MKYRRAWVPGGTFFFTLTLENRRADALVRHIDLLRSAFESVRNAHSFEVDAIVVLPEHLHAIWTMPAGDSDFALRWALIKAQFSRSLPQNESISASRVAKRERGIWQRRFWEHQIRDGADFERHVDYIHFNPVKHRCVSRVVDWPFSSFHRSSVRFN